MATEIVEKVFSCFDINTPEFYDYIQAVFNTGYYVQVALEKLSNSISEHQRIPPETIEANLIKFLLSNDTSIASPTETLMIMLYGLEHKRTKDLSSKLLMKVNECNAEQACRILEVAVQVSLKSNENLREVEEIIKFCLYNREFQADILFQMNLLGILQNLLIVDYGFEYLERNGILKHFAEQVINPEMSLVAPGIMRFFTHAAVWNPGKILNEYSPLVELLLTIIRDEDNFHVTTLETLGQIFLTNDSKRILSEKYDRLCCETLRRLFGSISNFPSDLKPRVFECFEKVFTVDDPSNINNQITFICERWYQQSGLSFSSLVGYCKQPFQDISLASFRLIHSLTSHAFGRNALAQTGGFVEFLLDRNSISSYDVAMIKYEIIKKLSTATEFDVTTITSFSTYVRNGTYYSDQSATAILTE